MKIKSLLFPFAVVALVAVISYYIGGSMRGTNSDQQSIHTIKKQLEYAINNSVEKEIKANLIACHVDRPEIFSNLAAKIRYESSVLTKTGNGKYMGFVKISNGDIIEVDILIDDEGFYYSVAKGWESLQRSIGNERRKMGIKSDIEINTEEFERRYNIPPAYQTYR